MAFDYFVYIMSNSYKNVIYVGFTNNLKRRVWEHKNGVHDGFTKKYNVNELVYYEHYTNVWSAIKREKAIKGWRRERKNELINAKNAEWKDLSQELFSSL